MVRHLSAISISCCFKEPRICWASSSHSRALARYSSALSVTTVAPVCTPVCTLPDERNWRRVVPAYHRENQAPKQGLEEIAGRSPHDAGDPCLDPSHPSFPF